MRSFLSLLLVVLALIDAQAQLFMRAYAPEEATFYPPNYYAYCRSAAVTPTGYVLANFYGITCGLDMDGETQSCHRLRRPSSLASTGIYLEMAESHSADVFYYGALNNDTMFVLKSNGVASIAWQAGMAGANTGEKLLPTGDGGCALLYRIGNAGSQRATIVRYGADGAVLWRKAYRIPGNNASFTARGLTRTADGGYLITGKYGAGASSRMFVCRLNANGVVAWAREIGTGNGGYDEGLTATELPNGNIRVALILPQPSMYLGMVDLTSTGSFVDSWGYQGATSSVGSLRFTADGSAFATGGNGSEVFRLAPDGTVVFALNQDGPAGTTMQCEQLLPKSDGTQVMLGNYTTNPFTNSIGALYASGPLGVLPSPFSSPYSFSPAAYTATISAISPADSTLTGGFAPQLSFEGIATWADTLFATPNAVSERSAEAFNLRVHPNPADERLVIESGADLAGATLHVMDANGRCVLATQLSAAAQHVLSISSIAPGPYLIEAATRHGVITEWFIKR